MSRPEQRPDSSHSEIHREYMMDVRIVTVHDAEATRYRFEAPEHVDVEFEAADTAELYADVYFDVNGFREEGTGDIGVPPEIVQAGKDTLAAYLLTQPHTTRSWVASFYGTRHETLDRYVSWVRDRAEELRAEARRQGVE